MSAKGMTVLVAVGLSGWGGGAQAAPADSGVVVVGGSAGERDRATVDAAIEGVAKDAGWSLPAKILSKKDSDGLLHCADFTSPWTCVPGSLRASGIRQVFVVTVEPGQADNGAPMIVITGRLIVTDPQSVLVKQRYCEHCADDKLGEAGTDLAKQLLRELAVRDGHTVVAVKSIPTGAQVVLDGETIGTTNGTFNTFPGRHVVIVEKPGHLSETKAFVVEEGKTAEIDVTLRASSSGDHHTPNHRSRLVAGFLVGAGTAAIVTGGVLIAIDETPRLQGPQKPDYYHTMPIGIGTAIGGAVVLGVGFYLWFHGAPRAPGAPTATLTSGGGAVGWTGTF